MQDGDKRPWRLDRMQAGRRQLCFRRDAFHASATLYPLDERPNKGHISRTV